MDGVSLIGGKLTGYQYSKLRLPAREIKGERRATKKVKKGVLVDYTYQLPQTDRKLVPKMGKGEVTFQFLGDQSLYCHCRFSLIQSQKKKEEKCPRRRSCLLFWGRFHRRRGGGLGPKSSQPIPKKLQIRGHPQAVNPPHKKMYLLQYFKLKLH